VASGKSFVAEQLAHLGAVVLDADAAAHEVLCLPRVEVAARERWGAEIFGAEERIDRHRLAGIVFGPSPEAARERKFLENLTHPEIGHLLRRQAQQWAAAGRPVAVLDAPLLLEAGWDRFCDRLLFVDAPWAVRWGRAAARQWSAADFSAREEAQKSLDVKRRRADVVIDNSGPPECTRAQVQQFWHTLVG
jgi:dephospho-CoA kinase